MNSTHPRFIVLLATYNGAAWVVEQVQSILDQVDVAVDIYVADDASTDGTVDLLKSHFSDVSQLHYLEFDKPAGGAAKNFIRAMCAVEIADCDFLSFADQDDIWHKDKLKIAAHALVKSGCAAYSCSTNAFWHDGTVRLLGQNANVREWDFLFEGAGQGCSFVLNAKFALEAVEKIEAGGALIQGIHYHDWLVYAICRASGQEWYFDPSPHLDYRQHGGNDTGARFSLKGVGHRLLKIKDGWYFEQVRLILYFLCDGNLIAFNKKSPLSRMLLGYGFLDRLKFLVWNLKNGRRRLSDRIVVSFAIAVGWHLEGVDE